MGLDIVLTVILFASALREASLDDAWLALFQTFVAGFFLRGLISRAFGGSGTDG